MRGPGEVNMRRMTVLLTALSVAAWTAAAEPPDLTAVSRRLDSLFRSDSSVARVELSTQNGGQKRSLQMKVWSLGRDKALIVIEAPPREAGTATLKIKNDLWNYLPNIARTIRVPPSMMLASWMGTDFTNDDLVKESSMETDFTAALEGKSRDPPGWIVRYDAKEGMVGRWQTIRYWMNEDGTLPIRVEFFDRKGRLSRTFAYSDVKPFGDQVLPSRLTLTTADENKKTEMHWIDIQFGVAVPESTFSLSRLEKK